MEQNLEDKIHPATGDNTDEPEGTMLSKMRQRETGTVWFHRYVESKK